MWLYDNIFANVITCNVNVYYSVDLIHIFKPNVFVLWLHDKDKSLQRNFIMFFEKKLCTTLLENVNQNNGKFQFVDSELEYLGVGAMDLIDDPLIIADTLRWKQFFKR